MIWLVMAIPMLVPLAAAFYYKQNRGIGEYAIHIALTIALTCAVFYAGKYYPAWDYQILNGYVTNKQKVYNPRTEYYDCNCRTVTTGSGKNRSSHRQCSTCSRTIPEWDWTVYTNVGNLNINRIDSAGRKEPPRWTQVQIGEPASIESGYLNQIKGVKDSIFHYDKSLIKKYEDDIPEYPHVTDYYRFDHVINKTKLDTKGWNDYINSRLKTLGSQIQVNVMVILTDKDYDYFDALKYKWLSGKKNDVVMVIGVDENKVKWFGSTSLADGYKNQTLHSMLRMNSHDRELDAGYLGEQIDIIAKEFKRTPMKEFDYLTDESEPPGWVMLLAVMIGIAGSCGVSYGIHRVSTTNFSRYRRF
ncbi:hypothetical protein AVV44_gp025 [Cronobacter phage S13]|uniref:TPM domain-containing protein n=1 Tax=Cronobacter phage LPCS28 TaxID=2924885 RepID=A0AAE9G4V4_9CAUD|nr:hypothetical protein AVV44_gp025 [Cronobacter phage S13]YP_010665876.1 hypothetical protein PQB73_gp148 [Cronobacter phage LPCS28]AIA64824.1 hypothetical protein S13_025 [Cronobacter phage S13]UNY47065.1 hypothetical protein EHEKIMEA_00183 [Cronobacter phage LPCS28]